MTKMDQARLAVAAYGKKTYTSTDIQQALGGYINTPQCMIEMRRHGEIEAAGRGEDGRTIVWRTVKLRPVRKPKTVQPAANTQPAEPEPTYQTQCALRLHAVLDRITRNRMTSTPRKTNHPKGATP